MAVTQYRLFGKTESPRSSTLAELWDVGVLAQAKRSETNPYEIANEIIGLRLGQALNLPIPPGVVVTEGGQQFFCSMFFGGSGHQLPPADAEQVAIAHSHLAVGIVLFDCWICNPDRHDGNISLNETTQEITLFDHGHSLLGDHGDVYQQYANRLCIDNHCVAAELRAFSGFDDWLDRICDIPRWYVKEIVHDATVIGVSDEQADLLSIFLLARREQLRSLFHAGQNNKTLFPKKQSTLFGVWGFSHGDIDDYCI
jgi:hypothetical protein